MSRASIHVGCSGWSVSQERYFKTFPCLELSSSFYNLPRLATAERWRQAAPKDFEFSIKAWQLITHAHSSPTYEKLTEKFPARALERCGSFKATDEVSSAWERTQGLAKALDAKFILFQTPSSFYANADHLRDMYRFFRSVERGKRQYVWEPRGSSWSEQLRTKIGKDLGLVLAVDPLVDAPAPGSVCYFRLHGRRDGSRIVYQHEYSDSELRELGERCEGRKGYVFFNNIQMWKDAIRFRALLSTHR